MKQTIQAFLFITALFFTQSTFAQAKEAYLKYEVNGKAFDIKAAQLSSYNISGGDGVDERKHTQNHFYIQILEDFEYKLEIKINTAPKTKPVVCKMPLVEIILPMDGYLPSAYISIDRYVGDDITFYSTTLLNEGKFEITKVEGDWVEGVFDLVITNSYEENDKLTITNGSFRFKIEPEMQE